jgi:hypothetical protein
MIGSVPQPIPDHAGWAPRAFLAWMRRQRRTLADAVVTEVPAALVACEYECRKPHCDLGHWITCARRLKAEAQASRPH